MKALETGGDFAKESKKAVWEMKAAVGADGIRLSTTAEESASLLKHGLAGTDGISGGLKGVKKSGSNTIKAIEGTSYDINKLVSGVQAYKMNCHILFQILEQQVFLIQQ